VFIGKLIDQTYYVVGRVMARALLESSWRPSWLRTTGIVAACTHKQSNPGSGEPSTDLFSWFKAQAISAPCKYERPEIMTWLHATSPKHWYCPKCDANMNFLPGQARPSHFAMRCLLVTSVRFHPVADPASECGGDDFSNICWSVLATALPLQDRWNILYNTPVTKQWTTNWPCIANVVFRIIQNHGE